MKPPRLPRPTLAPRPKAAWRRTKGGTAFRSGHAAEWVAAVFLMAKGYRILGFRLKDSLTDMAAVLGPRPAAVARELTKLYEECVRGPLDALAVDPRLDGPKGEIVVVVGPGAVEQATEAEADAALAEALTRLPTGEAAAEVAKALGLNRKTLYRRALDLQGR